MRTRQIVALGMAVAMATVMTLQPATAGNRQGAGSISGIAIDAHKEDGRYDRYRVRGRIVDGPGAGNVTQVVPLDTESKFVLPGIDLAKYEVELLREKKNKPGEYDVICTEGDFDLTKEPNRTDARIDCGNPAAWWLLAAAAAAITAGVVTTGDAVSPAR